MEPFASDLSARRGSLRSVRRPLAHCAGLPAAADYFRRIRPTHPTCQDRRWASQQGAAEEAQSVIRWSRRRRHGWRGNLQAKQTWTG